VQTTSFVTVYFNFLTTLRTESFLQRNIRNNGKGTEIFVFLFVRFFRLSVCSVVKNILSLVKKENRQLQYLFENNMDRIDKIFRIDKLENL
jgi:hypothetical protein